jgi:hypothetical protein
MGLPCFSLTDFINSLHFGLGDQPLYANLLMLILCVANGMSKIRLLCAAHPWVD